MTEFGKTALLPTKTLESLGFNLVIWPVTMLRLAMGVVEEALDVLEATGTQESLVGRMQTRSRLYELVDYASYQQFDEEIFNFELPEGD
jgi:methylisocitrate lyase